MIAKIDLHMHSINSGDGTLTPRELVEEVKEKEIEIFSITEHNTIKTHIDCDYQLSSNQKILTGVEVNTFIDGESIELLCYGFDIKEASKLEYINREKEEIEKLIFAKVKSKIEKQGFELGDLCYEDKRFAKDIIFNALKKNKKNYLKVPELEDMNISIFYRRNWVVKESPFYADIEEFYPSVDKIIQDFRNIDSVIFIAHPYTYPQSEKVIKTIIDKVDGVECGHSMCSLENTQKLIDLCRSKNKLISGGSDYHGTKSAIPQRKLGVYYQNKEIEQEIYKWVLKYTEKNKVEK